MKRLPWIRSVARFTVTGYKEFVEYLRSGYLRVVEPLIARYSSAGLTLAVDEPPQFWAKITLDANPASWVELWPTPGGSWINKLNGRSGTENAYKSFDGAVPFEKVVWMRQGYKGKEWIYDFNRRQTEGCTEQICITLDSCYLFGTTNTALIEIKQGGTLIGSCTVPINGFTTEPCCVVVPEAGDYQVVVTPPAGQLGWTRTVNARECMTNNFTFRVYPETFEVCSSADGCEAVGGEDNGVEGVTIEYFDCHGDSVGSCVTDEFGECCLTVENDALTGPPCFPWTMTLTPPGGSGYLPVTQPALPTPVSKDQIHGCGFAVYGANLPVDEDHVCCSCPGFNEPLPKTITFFDACGASGTLTWGNWRIGPPFTMYPGWAGCLTYDEPMGSLVNSYGYCVGPVPIIATIWVILFCQPQTLKDAQDIPHLVRAVKEFPSCLDVYTNAPFGPFVRYIFPAHETGNCDERLLPPGWDRVFLPDETEYCSRPLNIVGTWTDFIDGASLVVDTETACSFIG